MLDLSWVNVGIPSYRPVNRYQYGISNQDVESHWVSRVSIKVDVMVLSYHSMFRSLRSCSGPVRSVPFLPVSHCVLYLHSFIGYHCSVSGLLQIWILLECPETIELIFLNPRNIPIPRYHRFSVGTVAHSHHDSWYVDLIIRIKPFGLVLARFSQPCNSADDSPDQTVDRIKIEYHFPILTIHNTPPGLPWTRVSNWQS